jgi:hypothetical protein
MNAFPAFEQFATHALVPNVAVPKNCPRHRYRALCVIGRLADSPLVAPVAGITRDNRPGRSLECLTFT